MVAVPGLVAALVVLAVVALAGELAVVAGGRGPDARHRRPQLAAVAMRCRRSLVLTVAGRELEIELRASSPRSSPGLAMTPPLFDSRIERMLDAEHALVAALIRTGACEFEAALSIAVFCPKRALIDELPFW